MKYSFEKYGLKYEQVGPIAKASFLGVTIFKRVDTRFKLFWMCGKLKCHDEQI